VRDGLPDHWAEMLGLALGQVNEAGEVGAIMDLLLEFNPRSLINDQSKIVPSRIRAALGASASKKSKYRNAIACLSL